jgi:hypothetical protein
MRLTPNLFSIFTVIFTFLLSSCVSKDPFKKEVQTSTLNVATHFLENFENPKNEKGIHSAYGDLDEKTQEHLSYTQFRETILSTFPTGRVSRRTLEITPWEKYELEDGNALVYLLKKSDYSRIKFIFEKFSIIRLHLVQKESGFFVTFENPENLPNLPIVQEGFCADLNDTQIEILREKVTEDLEKFKFTMEQSRSLNREALLVKNCIAEGEKLYDKENYRAALMQFQKALSIDPENDKAATYVGRCQKAILLNLPPSQLPLTH